MSELSIHLFGKLLIQNPEQVPINLDARKAQELFCYLLLNPEKIHSRDKIANLLSENASTAKANKCLRQALWQLQSILDTGDIPLILTESDYIQLNPDVELWQDVYEFEQAYALSKGRPGHKLDEETVRGLNCAVNLYKGDLLEGWYQDWCLFHRERLENMYLTLLIKLISYCEAHEQYETGISLGQRVLEIDRAHERVHRQLMRLLYLNGNRTGALRQYKRCVAALDEELGVCPAKKTDALYKLICMDEFEKLNSSPGRRTVPATFSRTTALENLLKELEGIQTDIETIHDGLDQNIGTVRQMLGDQMEAHP
jgi:DNA-binding SARP family transcriptional activator